ncbi:T9SS type A sorting domain-containing protein [Dokdonia sp. Hel_I_53]|uniref:T9SS type A sorting domain-containing protein n=1 Tax=Dokdonia sp. Hel_I_53 TaxID=1566287 RepID=UPI001646DFC3|nr:T9SS type A sorting domain-containing protein [Dokdonia sp. Hel_I_53]
MKKQLLLLSLILFVFVFAKAQTDIQISYDTTAGSTLGDKIVTVNFQEPDDILISEITTSDVTVNGDDDGFLIVGIQGGTPIGSMTLSPYTVTLLKNGTAYSGATTNGTVNGSIYEVTFGSLDAGVGTNSYSVSVTDANGCMKSLSSLEIDEPQPFVLNTSITTISQPTCNGDVGQITVRAQGGLPDYQYQLLKETPAGSGTYINDGPSADRDTATNYIATGLAPANYRIEVKDSNGSGNGSILSDIFSINAVSPVIFSLGTPTDVSCLNGSDGSIFVTVTGGSSSYNFSWTKSEDSNFSSSSQNLENVTAGTYTLNVKDTNNCAGTVPMGELSIASITEPTSTITTSSTPTPIIIDPTSPGAMDGSIDIMFTGGTPKTTGAPYDYQWRKNGSTAILFTTRVISALDAGIYEVTVIDENGCEEVFEETLEDPLPLVVAIQENAAISCNGGTGILEAIGNGGIASNADPYTYQWFNVTTGSPVNIGITTAIANNLTAGNYSVIITDNNGITVQDDFNLMEPTALSFTATNSTDVSCNGGNNGSGNVNVTGGSNTYTYAWSKAGDASFSASTAAITDLTAGTYTVRVDDASGGVNCFITTTITINEPSSPVVINLDNQIDIAINGESTGSLEVSVSGGTPGYSYTWTKTGDAAFTETTEDIFNLSAGTYTLLVTDSNFNTGSGNNGCTFSQLFTLTEPDQLTVDILKNTGIPCNGDALGILDAMVTGGVMNYTYQWQEFISGAYVDIPTASASTSQLINVSDGNYRVEVVDSNGAMVSNDFDLTEPPPISLSNIQSENVACFNTATGSILLDVSGGTGAYTYDWKDESNMTVSSTEDLLNTTEGIYTLTVSDANGCSITSNPITINQPSSALSITTNAISNLSGFETGDGSITITTNGGTPGYSYNWTKDGDINFNATTEDLSALDEGTYNVTITDAKNCIIQESFIVAEPPLLEITTINQTNLNLCFGDSTTDIEATAVGGVPSYSYTWYLNTNPSIILSTTNILSDRAVGIYTLIVQDINGNIAQDTNIVVAQPEDFTVSEIHTDVLCNGGATGTIDITVNGGTPFTTGAAYSYIWSNGETTEDISNLSIGSYTVTITDANNCQTNLSINISEPPTLEIDNSTVTNTSGNGLSNGSVSVVINGGTPGYTYEWTDVNGAILSNTNIISNVPAGTYTLEVTDINGCTVTPTDFEVAEPEALSLNINELSITCNGDFGSLEAAVDGGVPPYTYSWIDSTNTEISNSSNSGNIIAGFYTIFIEDRNGNTTSIIGYEFTEPSVLEISGILTNVTCYNARDGIINLNVTGGSGAYDISWNHDINNTGLMASGLSGGTYTVTIVDQLDTSCILTESFTIQEPQPYGINNIIVTTPSSSNNDGSISLNVFGGTAPFTYNWRDENGTIISSSVGAAATSISNLPEGDYTLTITDSSPFSCTITNTFTLGLPGELLVDIEQTNSVSCFGGNDGEITVTTNTGVNTFTWYDASFNPPVPLSNLFTSIVQVPAGTYYVEVYDAIQSITEISAPIVITEPDAVIASASTTEVKCFDQSNGTITVTAEGGNGTYEYVYRLVGSSYPTGWITFDNGTSTTISNLPEGDYEIRVRDTLDCTYNNNGSLVNVPVSVAQPDKLTIASTNVINSSGNGLSNGSVSVMISGGTLNYEYLWVDNLGTIISTSDSITNVSAGTYTLIVTDANGCTITPTEFEVTEPDPLTVSAEITNIILCNGDSSGILSATAIGGVPFSNAPNDYNFEWFDTSTTEVIGTNAVLAAINAGTYYVVITDANANITSSEIIEITEPDALIVTLTAEYSLCGDGNDWTITSLVTGGISNYNYIWNTGATTPDLSNTLPGEYVLTVSDQFGCVTSKMITLIPPPDLVASNTITNTTCYGGNDGSIQLIANGGTPPYTYVWDNGDSTDYISDLEAGNYQVSIIDSKGCEYIETYEVTEPTETIIDLGSDITLCLDQTLELDATIIDGVTYEWFSDNGFTSSSAQVVLFEEGSYTVTATNTSGCIVTDEIFVATAQQPINAEFLVSSQVFTNQPFIMVQVSEPFPNTVEWILPDEASILEMDTDYVELSFDTAGEYEIVLMITNGNCTDIQIKQIVVIDGEDFNVELNSSNDPLISSLIVYPNPSSGIFSVDIELREAMPLSIKIFGINSNNVIDSRLLEDQVFYSESFNLSVPAGVYFILVETPNSTMLKKIIIE